MIVLAAADSQTHDSGHARATDPFLNRCESLLENWTILAGTSGDVVQAFRIAAARIGAVRNSSARRSWLSASPSGAPIELRESIAQRGRGPAFLCNPAPNDGPPSMRLHAALERANAFTHGAGIAAGLVDSLARSVQPSDVWLAADADGRTVSLQCFPLEQGRTSARAARACLERLHIDCPFATRRSLALLADAGKLRTIAVEVRRGARPSAHLTFCHPFDRDVVSLAAACGVPGEAFERYLSRVLRFAPHAVERRAQATLTISASGAVAGLDLAHYTAPYFRSDGDLRAAILDNAQSFGWDPAHYRTASALVGSPSDGSRARCYMRFGVARTGAAHLDVYASPGRLLTGSALQGASHVDVI